MVKKYFYDPNLSAIVVQYLNIQMIISLDLSHCHTCWERFVWDEIKPDQK